MATFRVDLRDVRFVLFEQIGVDSLLKIDAFKEQSQEEYEQILSEGKRFAEERLGPTNGLGDKKGSVLKDGQVYFPEELVEIYKEFQENGWAALAGSPEHGGMGLPYLINLAVGEFIMSANLAFSMTPGLTLGVSRLIEHFGDDRQKHLFLEKLTTGEWAGTMCLTEPQAGSAVGDLSTTAEPIGDGMYKIKGNKIFISSGDQNFTDNIVHAVLARVKGAPNGIKGVSLFLIPKHRVNDDGSLGKFNDVNVAGIEHKMGLHANSTCSLNFGENDDCVGYLIGGENNGIKCMFLLMNEARIAVGVQGLSQAARAHNLSIDYSKERVQGTDIKDRRDANAPRVQIIKHPDVRRMLLLQKALVDGMRSLLYTAGYWYDLSEKGTGEEADKARMLVDLLTPVCKAYCSDMGFRVTDLGIQVHGGYGYIKEYEVEQLMRDTKIATIYEGTNGIQALDLLGRKVPQSGGMLAMTYIMELTSFCSQYDSHPVLGKHVKALESAKDTLGETTMKLQEISMSGDEHQAVQFATPYLEMFGEVTLAYFLLHGAVKAQAKLDEIYAAKGATTAEARKALLADHDDARFYAGRVKSAEFFCSNVLPGVRMKAAVLKNMDSSALEMVW